MKRLSVLASVSVLALAAGPLFAAGKWTRGPRVVQRPSASSASSTAAQKSARVNPSAATAAGYSVQLNIVTRVQGTSFFRTAVDITNNTTTDGVTAAYQYCYTLNGSFRGCTPTQTIVLHPLDNFHTDDIVQFLGNVLEPGAADLSFGTFIVTFDGLPSGNGWEGTVTGRTYSPSGTGTVAIAYPASLFFESASGSLVGTVRDTRPAPTEAGALRTNLGITNTALFDTHEPGHGPDQRLRRDRGQHHRRSEGRQHPDPDAAAGRGPADQRPVHRGRRAQQRPLGDRVHRHPGTGEHDESADDRGIHQHPRRRRPRMAPTSR